MSQEAFISRTEELSDLETLWQSDGLTTCCVYGHKTIGKSRLLEEFSKGKRTLYLQAVQASCYENLSSLAMDISAFRGNDIGELKDLTHLMAEIESICSEEHTLVIFDELPYLLECAPQTASVIQKSLDRGLKNCHCMFVICGSSISVMRKETEDCGRPLYGRFGSVMQIGYLSPEESLKFCSGTSAIDVLKWYLTVGGIPQYLKAMAKGTYESGVEEHFFEPASSWKDDAPQVILQEFKGNRNYTGAVKCISDGSVKQSEIAEKLGIDRAACKRMLDDLEFVNIIEKRHPMAGAPKKPVYRIKDPFIAFHYGIVSRNSKLIETSRSPEATYALLRMKIDSHLGHMFEVFCAQWLEKHFTVTEIGSWWGRDSDGEITDIDIIAKVADSTGLIHTLVCECKFSRNPVDFTPLNTLTERCKSASINENVKYVLFSAGGFQDDLREYAEETGILLVDSDILMGLKKVPDLF